MPQLVGLKVLRAGPWTPIIFGLTTLVRGRDRSRDWGRVRVRARVQVRVWLRVRDRCRLSSGHS